MSNTELRRIWPANAQTVFSSDFEVFDLPCSDDLIISPGLWHGIYTSGPEGEIDLVLESDGRLSPVGVTPNGQSLVINDLDAQRLWQIGCTE